MCQTIRFMNEAASDYKDHHCSPGTANYNKTSVFSRVLREELEELQKKNDMAILQSNTIVNQPEGSNSSPLNSKSLPMFHTLVTSDYNILQDWQCYVFLSCYALFPVTMHNNTGKF